MTTRTASTAGPRSNRFILSFHSLKFRLRGAWRPELADLRGPRAAILRRKGKLVRYFHPAQDAAKMPC
jgi:hypothetical protein